MNTYRHLLLVILPFFLLACSFSANLDNGKPSTVPIPIPTQSCEPNEDPGQGVSDQLGTNVALNKPVISRGGGVTWKDWGNANDSEDYGTTTHAEKGRWGNETNNGGGTYEVVDLGREYTLTGVGYSLDWDGAFTNSLTFQVLVSTNNEDWTLVANTIHRYPGGGSVSHTDIDLAIIPTTARYVKYWEPPDGAWNGWGDLFQLRAYAEE